MLDPQADSGRHAFLPCPYCDDNTGLYLLFSEVNMVWVQCSRCLRRWWQDTGCGRGGRPDHLFDVA